jgi:hypothetical protein
MIKMESEIDRNKLKKLDMNFLWELYRFYCLANNQPNSVITIGKFLALLDEMKNFMEYRRHNDRRRMAKTIK